MTKRKKIALVGNPNSGKSSLFNQLTGLNQKTGNFPGVTVERKNGISKYDEQTEWEIIDLPGTYSLFPTSQDERITSQVLTNLHDKDYPDVIVYIADVTHLERHFLLLTQLMDLDFPIILALSMNDVAEQRQLTCDENVLKKKLGIPVVKINSRKSTGIKELKEELFNLLQSGESSNKLQLKKWQASELQLATAIADELPVKNNYHAFLLAHHLSKNSFLADHEKQKINQLIQENNTDILSAQLEEIMERYNAFTPIVNASLRRTRQHAQTLSDKIDNFITHPILGPILFFLILFLFFQAIFSWSVVPMEAIDIFFSRIAEKLHTTLPDSIFSRILTEGIIPGISGVLVFVPQISILFFFIAVLDEIGYMSRAIFLFDNIMLKFGLNGRSIVSLISGGACAIPAIMSARTIGNWKERLITIMVTPWISCSARIPVYAILIGLVIPVKKIAGFNLQGIVFMLLYLTGIFAALSAAFVFKKVLKTEEPSFLMMELPDYKFPHWKNVVLNVYDKVKSFVLGAGKIILIVSVLLWFMASFSPFPTKTDHLIKEEIAAKNFSNPTELQHFNEEKKLEYSYAGYMGKMIEPVIKYAGYMGKMIEPVIKPLGYDWKIGIALITSFAAREVFVGTISTLYSIGKDASDLTIKQKLAKEKKEDGTAVFSFATAISLLIFYVFAMQCMSTLVTVNRETNSWKWPIIQLIFMTSTAYICSFLVYHILR